MQHNINGSNKLHCHLIQLRQRLHIVLLYLLCETWEETHCGFTLSQKLIATFQKFQIFATFWKNKRQDDKKYVFNQA